MLQEVVLAGYKIFISSGEASGDLHGSNLIRELLKLDPALRFIGMGGSSMTAAGLSGIDMKEVSVVGISEVISKSLHIISAQRQLKSMLHTEKPDAAIFIDFPDFNLRLAETAKQLAIPVIYYISPQVWAWRKQRIRKIARIVKKMLVILPFESSIYEDAGVDVEFVGHPLVDMTEASIDKAVARKLFGITTGKLVALLPGSRKEEIKRLFPSMLQAADLIKSKIADAVFILPVAATLSDNFVNGFIEKSKLPLITVRQKTNDVLKASDAAIVASGTATLEAALMIVPMVIIYKLSTMSYLLGRILVGKRDIGLPNIIAGERVVNELLQDEVSPENICSEIVSLLSNDIRRGEMITSLGKIRDSLGAKGASKRAAAAVYRELESLTA